MIKTFKAENYKSIKSLELELGRVNVFIGENGAGKSNILELFALASAALGNKLDNEFLASRGIRVTEPELMRPVFIRSDSSLPILITVTGHEGDDISIKLNNENLPYSKWHCELDEVWNSRLLAEIIDDYLKKHWINYNEPSGRASNAAESNKIKIELEFQEDSEAFRFASHNIQNIQHLKTIENLVVFSPENSALRVFERESQIEPLGIKGEGLLKLLSVLSKESNGETFQEIKSSLQVLGWFEDFKLVDGDTFSPSRIAIKDRYIEDETRWFDQMSANEGFLFLLFYFALFSTKLTPSIFAIDNIDASLNPALCEKLLSELVRLAKKHDKQVLLTTHNPATLDGLNLDDDEQRLFVVSRSRSGETRVRRIQKKASASENQRPVRLSEMFLRGSLGGIPKGF
ncbi:AAA family ATPase [Methylomagnum sp.]